MTTYAWPGTGGAFRQASASIGFVQNQRISISTLSGAVQTASLPGARLRQLITFPLQASALRASLEGFLNRLSGMEHRVSLWDVARPRPRGTCNLSGVTCSGGAAQFATTMSLAGCGASTTLLAGDWLRVPLSTGLFQVLQVSADAQANGSGVMAIEFRAMLRASVAAAAAVVLDKPAALYVLREEDGLMLPRGVLGHGPEFTAQFIEVFS